MSKKIFMKSYAEALKLNINAGEDQPLWQDLGGNHEGESLLKSKYLGFPYSRIGKLDTPAPIKNLRTSPRKRKTPSPALSKICSSKTTNSPIVISDSSTDETSPAKRTKRRTIRILPDLETFSPKADDDFKETEIVQTLETKRKLFDNTESDESDNSLPSLGDMKSDVLMTSDGTFTECYEQDWLMPIYKTLKTGIKTKEAVDILLSKLPSRQLTKTVPNDINRNAIFIYSVESIGHWKNALCDGMGRWNQSGTERNMCRQVEGKISISHRLDSDNSLIITRRKYQNHSDASLHRVVITLQTSEETDVLDQFLVQYYFDGAEKKIQVLPHGNSKAKSSYLRTSQTTKNRIVELCQTQNHAPKNVVHTIIEEQGGLETVTGASAIPRNRQQVSNMKRNRQENKVSDALIEVADLAKQQEKGENRFVRDVRAAPEFTMFLCSDRQLADLKKFCTNTGKFCVAGIDTTFNIGQYYVTILTYRHLMLQTTNGKEPVMIGPTLLHQRKDFDSYFKLSSGLIQECKGLLNLKVFGTDGDVNLSDAFLASFPGSKHLLCDIHMFDNIERQLKKLGIVGQTAKLYTNDIFGSSKGSIKIKGLIDSTSTDEFNRRLSELKEVWSERHCQGTTFYKYFNEYKADLIKNTMTAEIRSECGLGFPPQVYTQNANECINSILKSDIEKEKGRKVKLDPYEFAKLLQKFVKRQENEIKMSMIGKGELHLKEEYQHLYVDETVYWKKSGYQREAVFKRFQDEPLKVLADDHDFTFEMGQTHDSRHLLSISAENSNITHIPFPILSGMFSAAEDLLKDGSNIVAQPGSSEKIYIVANVVRQSEPYFIKYIPSSAMFNCSNKCHRFNGFSICEHSLATAEFIGILDTYLKNYLHRNSKYSVTNMANTNMAASRGKKSTKATERRKGQSHKPETVITEYQDSHQPIAPNDQPFHLTFCAGLIKKCYGCNQEFSTKQRKPPNDLLLKRFDHRVYISPRSKVRKQTATLQSTYFHLSTECARRVQPKFELTDIIIHSEIKGQLKNEHKGLLQKLGIECIE